MELRAAAPKPAPVLSVSADGAISYHADEQGNRVPDFSMCGYAGGERPIPNAPVKVTVEPRAGDSTRRIQRALDHVAGLPLDASGVRGAVLLLAGEHKVFGGLHITNSGVVLRGQGIGAGGTTLLAMRVDRRTLIRIAGRNDARVRTNADWKIADSCVPVGAMSFALRSAAGLKVGESIRIVRPSTQQWIDQLGAAEFGGGIGGGWKPGSRDIVWDRIVKEIQGNRLTIDAPITTALEPSPSRRRGHDSQPSNPQSAVPAPQSESETPYVVSYRWDGRIHDAGVENLTLVSEFDRANPKDEDHSWCAVTVENASDCWVRQVAFRHFAGSAVAIYESGRRITVQDCVSLEPVSEIGGYRRHAFFTMGQQTLFLRCYSENGRHDFSAGHCAAGPNAFVQCESRGALAESGPIESWASGVLYDNVVIDGNALTLGFRTGSSAAFGWSAANCVLWNCSASVIRCWNPPGAQNWAFGSWGSFEGDGVWRGSNNFMDPDSLYAAQLANRFGTNAAARLQLMPRPHEESSNPTLDKAQELAAAAHRPAPQLKDYILAAAKRDPIPSEPSGGAKRSEDLSLTPGFSQVTRGTNVHLTASAVLGEAVETAGNSRHTNTGLKPGVNEIESQDADQIRSPETQGSNHQSSIVSRLVLTNGWMTVDGKLLVGGTATVTWWRGNIRPEEAKEYGLGVTRFVPGRTGPGFTDNLSEVADTMIRNGDVALNHNHGLWYDRRRDDHQRVRRMDGDVLPPFLEQPFARSGQGMAWDGLSQYDLTKFNPWYWSRLREFAGVCGQRGLVLFHQNYFQHNILEAGAHWADFPWRSANNINETGFPEPPPYAGDKRIFMAELFYDVNHPVRRKLHEGYIRQCLENFKTNANVIQFTGAEFTGPLHFMQFWLDTITEWKEERSRRADEADVSKIRLTSSATRPRIALSATKDVQDAILADPKRSAIVDVIDFRYWWRTDKGEFAPPGGKNLAPRQFERQWRGGRPTDSDLAGMAAEYRATFPTKPLICNFDSAGWAWLCAGGSMPRLPAATDAQLLAAIPRMLPWTEASNKGRWVLRESGKQFLAYGGGELDLSAESGTFHVRVIDPTTGMITANESVRAGSPVRLPGAQVVWLTKE